MQSNEKTVIAVEVEDDCTARIRCSDGTQWYDPCYTYDYEEGDLVDVSDMMEVEPWLK